MNSYDKDCKKIVEFSFVCPLSGENNWFYKSYCFHFHILAFDVSTMKE